MQGYECEVGEEVRVIRQMALEICVRGNMEVLLRGRQHAMTMMRDYSQIAHCAISVFDPDAPGLSEFCGEVVKL